MMTGSFLEVTVAQRSADAAKAALEEVGFPLVRRDVPISTTGARRFRADLVAWGADADGELRPYVAVEVKSPSAGPSAVEAALLSLSVARDLLGTRVHYIVSGSTWLQADSGLQAAQPVPGPLRPPSTGRLKISDPDIARRLLDQRIGELAEGRQERISRSPVVDALLELLDELAQHPGTLQVGNRDAQVPDVVLWPALRTAARHTLARDQSFNAHTSVPELADPMAALLGPLRDGVAVDPFCGVGSLLWAVAERAARGDHRISLRGYDLDPTVAEVARRLGALSPLPPTIEVRDSLQAPGDEADFVVAEPPIGLNLSEHFALAELGKTRDGDLAVIDACLRALRPAGRAVIHMSIGWTFRGGIAERFRDHLLDACRVTALIGLPAGTFTDTSVPSILVVLDKAAPTDTFVCQLSADWPVQLSSGGAALADYLSHAGSVPPHPVHEYD
jgi:SAM-dependent methyltransferase